MTGSENANFHRSGTVDVVLRESRKNWVSNMFHKYPSVCVCVSLTIALICAVVALPNMKMSDDGNRAYLVWDDIRVERQDSFNDALDKIDVENQKKNPVDIQTESIPEWTVWVLYEAKDSVSNLLTPTSINDMQNLQGQIAAHKRYSKVCLQSYDDAAGKRICNVNKKTTVGFYPDHTTQTDINTRTDGIMTDNDLYLELKPYFEKGWTNTQRSVKWTRAMIQHGAPLDIDGKVYKYYKEDEEAQDEYFTDYVLDIADTVDDFDSSNFDTYFYNKKWFDKRSDELVMQDFAFVGLSLAFVIFYMMVHTRSVILPLIGMFQVMLAFPVAFCIYRYIMQITYFNMMSLLSIFVILGIAADDIFVFVDAWNQAQEHEILMSDLERRISWVYRRAANAMFVTTLTTFCAFLATGLSKIMPIAAFGIFSANVIASNYVLVITCFPGVVVLREKFMRWRKNRGQKTNEADAKEGYASSARNEKEADLEKGQEIAAVAKVADVDPYVKSSNASSVSGSGFRSDEIRQAAGEGIAQADNHHVDAVDKAPVDPVDPEEKMSKFDRFCFTKYSQGLNKAKFAVVALFAVWFILSCVFTAQLSPPTESEKWVPDDHWLMKALNAMEDNFPKGANDNAQIVYIIWGVDGLDKSGIDDPWDPTDFGKVVWDNNFNPASQANQLRFKAICEDLKSDSYSHVVLDKNVDCFIHEFEEFITQEKNGTFPVPEDQFVANMTEFLENDKYGATFRNDDAIGLLDSRIYYAFFKIIGVGDRGPKSTLHPRWERWEDLTKAFNNGSGAGLNNGFQTSPWWTWYMSEETLVKDAIQGMLIAGSVSFVILVITTHNIILASYAILCIAGIVTSVMSIVYFQGWDFGTAESIAVVILIGFSVDYVVHICHAYVESHHRSKMERTRDALSKMAISIVGGAVTTFGDGCMLFFTTFIFFQKFAWIVTSTIFFALIWSLVFFPALLFIVGPQGETGDLKVLAKKIYTKYQESKNKKSQEA